MTEFLAMDGHGVYVWSAYGVSLLVLIGVGAWPLLTMRRLTRHLRRQSDKHVVGAGKHMVADASAAPEPHP